MGDGLFFSRKKKREKRLREREREKPESKFEGGGVLVPSRDCFTKERICCCWSSSKVWASKFDPFAFEGRYPREVQTGSSPSIFLQSGRKEFLNQKKKRVSWSKKQKRVFEKKRGGRGKKRKGKKKEKNKERKVNQTEKKEEEKEIQKTKMT